MYTGEMTPENAFPDDISAKTGIEFDYSRCEMHNTISRGNVSGYVTARHPECKTVLKIPFFHKPRFGPLVVVVVKDINLVDEVFEHIRTQLDERIRIGKATFKSTQCKDVLRDVWTNMPHFLYQPNLFNVIVTNAPYLYECCSNKRSRLINFDDMSLSQLCQNLMNPLLDKNLEQAIWGNGESTYAGVADRKGNSEEKGSTDSGKKNHNDMNSNNDGEVSEEVKAVPQTRTNMERTFLDQVLNDVRQGNIFDSNSYALLEATPGESIQKGLDIPSVWGSVREQVLVALTSDYVLNNPYRLRMATVSALLLMVTPLCYARFGTGARLGSKMPRSQVGYTGNQINALFRNFKDDRTISSWRIYGRKNV
jgi:hypothetical protein